MNPRTRGILIIGGTLGMIVSAIYIVVTEEYLAFIPLMLFWAVLYFGFATIGADKEQRAGERK